MDDAERKRAYQRAHYHANKERWRQKRMRYEAKVRALILAAKDRPCTDCGGRWHPLVMEFDHLPGTEKRPIWETVWPGGSAGKPFGRSWPSARWCVRRVTASGPCGAWEK